MDDERDEIDHEREAFAGLEAAELEERRRRFRETTMAERIETCFALSELATDLREAIERSR